MPDITVGFNQGLVTAQGREVLKPGELQTATGLYYKPGDPNRAHKLLGRSSFGTGSGIVKGLALCQFDSGTDRLVRFQGTSYAWATPGTTGTFADFTSGTGLNSSATRMSAAHFSDNWYLVNGYDRMKVVVDSTTTIRDAGMYPPTTLPTFAVSTATASISRPTAESNSGWVNPSFARDSTPGYVTYSHATASAAAAAKTCTWTTFGASSAANRVIKVVCRLDGQAPSGPFGIGGLTTGGYNVTLKVELLGDTGGTRTLYNETRTAPTAEPYLLLQSPITANSSAIQIRATFTYNSGTVQAMFRIDDIHIKAGGDQSAFALTDSIIYAVTEYDQVTKQESVPGSAPQYLEITPTAWGTANTIILTFPAAVNSRTTHFKVYRTFEGGSAPGDLGLRTTVPILDNAGAQITGVTWMDDFATGYTVDDSLFPIVPLLRVADRNTAEGELLFPRDPAPPTLSYVTAWKGSLVGLSREVPRALYYSAPSFPESWPEIYVITSFPLPERDELVAIVPCGDTLLVLAKGAALTLTDLPQVLDGVFNAAEASPLRAAPGCVGQYAATAYSVAGEPRVAWVSTFGIYSSNGQTVWRLSDDLDWSSAVYGPNLASAVLHWDSERQVLIFAYDTDASGTTNNRFYLIHMAPEHQKEDGRPKITGPHYGSINCMASGVVSGTYRLYSGHVSDGAVYLEGGAATDASSSYSGTQVPLIALTGRMFGQWRDWYAYKADLRHTDFGVGQTASILWSWGRDAGQTGSVTKSSVSLASQKGTEFFIGRSGEWAEMQLTHTGTGTGALLDCRVDVQIMDKSGRKVG